MRGPSFIILAASTALAQIDRASISGTISDGSGSVISGARVEVVSSDTGLRREAVTGIGGGYSLAQLPIGVYTLTASQAGFRTVAVKDLRLGVGDNRTLDLRIGWS